MSVPATEILVNGIVQGVGFRPFVYRLATGMGLTGWVRNGTEGVRIEACGTEERLAHFIRRIRREAPPLAVIVSLEHHALPDESSQNTSPSAKAATAASISLTMSPRMPPLRRLPAGTVRSRRPALPPPLHHLHQLRPPLQHHHRHPLRPAQHDHGFLSALP